MVGSVLLSLVLLTALSVDHISAAKPREIDCTKNRATNQKLDSLTVQIRNEKDGSVHCYFTVHNTRGNLENREVWRRECERDANGQALKPMFGKETVTATVVDINSKEEHDFLSKIYRQMRYLRTFVDIPVVKGLPDVRDGYQKTIPVDPKLAEGDDSTLCVFLEQNKLSVKKCAQPSSQTLGIFCEAVLKPPPPPKKPPPPPAEPAQPQEAKPPVENRTTPASASAPEIEVPSKGIVVDVSTKASDSVASSPTAGPVASGATSAWFTGSTMVAALWTTMWIAGRAVFQR